MNGYLITIVVPVYNEQEVIPYFYQEIINALGDINYELIFVNDGSTDSTRSKILDLNNNRVKLINLTHNFGQQIAILVGISQAKGDAICVTDADLQDPPTVIPKMIKKWHKGNKIVFAKRKSRQDRFLKVLLANTFYLILNIISRKKIDHNVGDFYLIDKSIASEISMSNRVCFLRAKLQLIKTKKACVYYDRKSRIAGKSKYSLTKMFKLALLPFKKECKIDVDKVIFRPKNIAVIGAGISGLTIGYLLSQLGHKIILYEKENQVGGLLKCTKTSNGLNIESFYHHFFKTDKHLIALLDELGLAKEINWQESKVSVFTNGYFYKFNGLINILELPILSVIEKLRLILGTLIIISLPTKWWRNCQAKELIAFLMGKGVWDKIWRPLFEGKFGDKTNNIKASWLVSRLKCRLFSRERGSEILGSLNGSFSVLIDELTNQIKKNDGKIIINNVRKIVENQSQIMVNNTKFDLVISTIAEPVLAQILKKNINNVKYLGAICALIELKNKKTNYYWTNILDQKIPYKCLIEHTNLIKDKYLNSLIYLGQYIDISSILYKKSDEKIKESFLSNLSKMINLEHNEIVNFKIFKYPYAQPIIDQKYKKMSPKITEKLYCTSMAHIYPEDRGLNYAIREAKRLVKAIGEL